MDKNTLICLKQRAAFMGIFMNFYSAFQSSKYYNEVLDTAENLYKKGYLLHREDYNFRKIKVNLTYNLQAPYIAWNVYLGPSETWNFSVSKRGNNLSWNNQTLLTKDKGSFPLMTDDAFTELLIGTREALRLYLQNKKIRVPILLRC